MIWLTWRQFRAQAVTAVAALALFAILLAVTQPQLASLYAARRPPQLPRGSGCGQLADSFLSALSNSAGRRPSGCCRTGPTST